jgi:hypothetical protein
MVDALEQILDSVTISDPSLDGDPGIVQLYYTLEGTNTTTGSDVGATFGGHGVPYACVKIGINNPTFPFGCKAYDGAGAFGTFLGGSFSFTYGTPFPLWFQLESIAGTGFGTSAQTGVGTSNANFYNTASIEGFVIYDQNMNPISGTPTITSALGAVYQDLNTPEPATGLLLVCRPG